MELKKNLEQAIKDWKAGAPVWTAELGGIGPGYEQAIQALLWEFLSRWQHGKIEMPDGLTSYPSKFSEEFDAVASELDKDMGFSGAQVGAAKSTAFQFLAYGYEHMMAKLPDDRWIQVSRNFPGLPKGTLQ